MRTRSAKKVVTPSNEICIGTHNFDFEDVVNLDDIEGLWRGIRHRRGTTNQVGIVRLECTMVIVSSQNKFVFDREVSGSPPRTSLQASRQGGVLWEKIKVAEDQLFSHKLIEAGTATNIDFKVPFHCTIRDTSCLPQDMTSNAEFEIDKSIEIFMGAIYGAWKAHIAKFSMALYTRCLSTSVICVHIGEEAKDQVAVRRLQQVQNAVAEYFVARESCLDFAKTYQDIVDGLVDRGARPTVKAVLTCTDKVKWCAKTQSEAKFSDRTLGAIKGIAQTFLDVKKNLNAIRVFNIYNGDEVLCQGYWYLDGLRNTCINVELIPQVIDRLGFYLRRSINKCNKRKITIDNIRGKPYNVKTESDAVLGYASLLA